MSVQPEIIVIGGGAAGIVAACRAAELGKSVLLLEKNDRLGMKILISGGGKCNLTHAGSMEDLRSKFRANEARFLKPSFYKFTNEQFLAVLRQRGLETYVRPDGRVFPQEPADAKTVVRLLTDYVIQSRVSVQTASAVSGLLVRDGCIQGVTVDNREVGASRVIVAVGGSSFPATGTTGDAYRWAKAIGHRIVPLRAALAPISLVEARPDWSGLALRSVVLKARLGRGGKEFVRWTGDLLYTHKGISGPSALGLSREVAERLAEARNEDVPFLTADLAPEIAFETLREELRAKATETPKLTVQSLIDHLGPSRLITELVLNAGVESGVRCSQLPAKTLTKIVTLLKEWPIGFVSHVPIERGEVVAGGVDLSEINSQTMESRIVSGLYLCGEVLDIAGPVGGYNLQAAWSTGYVAGTASATSGTA